MKRLVYFFLCVLMLSSGGCKEDTEDRCLDIGCGPHGFCENGGCNCDKFWTGTRCSQRVNPINSLVGFYHLVGQSQYWNVLDTTYYPPSLIDETLEVIKVSDFTVSIYGTNLEYIQPGDDTSYFNYLSQPRSPSNYKQLVFRQRFDDTAFYSSMSGGLGAGTNTNLIGKKIH